MCPPEFIKHEFVRWGTEQSIHIAFFQSGKLLKNVYIERDNRALGSSWLSKHLFDTLDDVQAYAKNWL